MTANLAYGIAAFFAVIFGAPGVVYLHNLYLGFLFNDVFFWTSLWLIIIGVAIASMVIEIRNMTKKKSDGQNN
jgi:hypothetical protein